MTATDVIASVQSLDDIFPQYRETPIEHLLAYHNLNMELQSYTRAELLIGMCMDHRTHLHIPDNFSYIIRTGGANLRYSEFKISYTIAIGGVQAIALIGHNNCGMVNLMARKDLFIENMVSIAGWTVTQAEEQFMSYAPMFEICNEVEFVVSEAKRLRTKYPKILIAPMIYRIEDNLLYLLHED